MRRLTHTGKKIAVVVGAMIIIGLYMLVLALITSEESGKETDVEQRSVFQTPFVMKSGATLQYSYTFHRRAAGKMAGLSRKQKQNIPKQFKSSTEFKGTLQLRVYKRIEADVQEDKRFLVGGKFTDLKLSMSRSGNARNTIRSLKKEFNKEMYFEMNPKGTLINFYFSPSLSRTTIKIWQEFLDGFIPIFPGKDWKTWTATHRNRFGLYKASYERSKDGTIVRTYDEFENSKFQRDLQPNQISVNSTLEYRPTRGNNSIRSVSGDLHVNISRKDNNSRMNLTQRRKWDVTLQKQTHQKNAYSSLLERHGVKDLEEFKNQFLLLGVGQLPKIQVSQEPQKSLSSSLKSLSSATKKSKKKIGNGRKIKKEVDNIKAHVQRNPGATIQAIKQQITDRDTSRSEKRVLISSLLQSQHKRAQSAIAELIRNESSTETGFILDQIWQVQKPAYDLQDAVTDRIREERPGSKHFRKSIRAAGMLVGRMKDNPSKRNQMIRNVLKQETRLKTIQDKVGFLDALGNSRHKVTLRYGKRYLYRSSSTKVKVAAVKALQRAPDPLKASEILLKYARKRAENGTGLMLHIVLSLIQIQKRGVAEKLPLDEVDSFLKQKLLSSEQMMIRRKTFSYFKSRLKDDPGVREILQKVAVSDDSKRLRKMAQKALEQKE